MGSTSLQTSLEQKKGEGSDRFRGGQRKKGDVKRRSKRRGQKSSPEKTKKARKRGRTKDADLFVYRRFWRGGVGGVRMRKKG